ncbi:MAG: prolyl oligopeptidase family serine peptidase [Longimicrobiales bacterium]
MIRRLPFITFALVVAPTLLSVGVTPAAVSAQAARFTVDDALEVASLQMRDLSQDGVWAAVFRGTLEGRLGLNSHRYGDPTYVSPQAGRLLIANTTTGESTDVFGRDVRVMSASWSPDASRLAMLILEAGDFELHLHDRGTGDTEVIPMESRIAGEGSPDLYWTADDRLLLPVRGPGWAEEATAAFDGLTKGPITVQSSDDPFLSWEALRRMGSEFALVELSLGDGSVREVMAPTAVGRSGYHMTEDRTTLVYDADVTEKTSYDVIFGTEGELRAVALATGQETVVVDVPENRRLRWSRDGSHYAYAEKGAVYVGAVDGGEPRHLIGPESEEGSAEAADASTGGDAEDEPRYSVQAVSPDGSAVIASSETGLWHVAVSSGEPALIVGKEKDDDEAPSYQVIGFGGDSGEVFLQYGSRTEWSRGVSRWSRPSGELNSLFVDDRLYSNFTQSKDGSRFVFNAAAGNRPYDLHVGLGAFQDQRVILRSNPDLTADALGDTELVRYLDADGDRLNGVVYYPPDYVQGTRYPTVFLVYEEFFDDRFNTTINILTNEGYVVMQPSVDLEVGFPGEAWAKGVTAAANTLIEMGVADPERLGVHGTSYGGYATNLLVTQTDRFQAAINISGKVDMISFYTDSPRLGVRNIHAPENSQDRLGATLWEQPQKYIAHSAIMFADRIETPLLLMTGEQDHNVPARTTFEMYYALRRLGKPVEWVNYVNGGHGMPRTNEVEVRDYYTRILDWYEKYLGDEAAEAKKVSPEDR